MRNADRIILTPHRAGPLAAALVLAMLLGCSDDLEYQEDVASRTDAATGQPDAEAEEQGSDAMDAKNVNFFRAEPGEIRLGEETILEWSVPDGAYCEITPDIGHVDYVGQQRTQPQATTMYTLFCPGGLGPAVLHTTVSVLPPT